MTSQPVAPTRNPWLAYVDLMSIGYSLYGVGSISPFLRDRLALTDAETGLHSTALAFGIVSAGFLTSRLGRRWPPPAVHLAAIGLMLVAWLALAWAPSFVVTLAAASGIGFGSGVVLSHTNAILAGVGGALARERLARGNVWSVVAAVCVPPVIAGSIALGAGWQCAFVPAALLLLLAATGTRDVRPAAAIHPTAPAALPGDFWRGWLLVAFVVSIEFSAVFWGATLVERRTGASIADATLVGGAFYIGMVAGRLTLSFRQVAGASPYGLIVVAICTAVAGTLITWVVNVEMGGVFGLFVAGCGVSVLYPLGVSVALQTSHEHLAVAGARLTIASGSAILIAPFVLGAVADALGVVAGWSLVPLFGLVSLGLALVVRRDGSRRMLGPAGAIRSS